MSNTPELETQKKGRSKSRRATMTSRSHIILGRALLLKASGAKSFAERVQNSHAQIWNVQEINEQFTLQYMDEQLDRAHRQGQWLR